ncbi:MAG: relaxase domain-containing protein [Propionibacteriaceae bacterium]
MSTGSAKMSRGGAGGLAAYLMEERLVGYYADKSGRAGQRIRSFGKDDVIFDAGQVHGRGVEAMGIDLSLGLTFGQFKNLCEGKHADTGEQLVKGGPRDVLDPETGEKTGTEQAHTMAIDTYFAPPKSVSVLAIVADKYQPELVPQVIAAHEAAVREAVGYVQSECRLGRRTVAKPSELVAAGGPRLVTKPGHERQGQASKQQGSKSDRVPVDLISITATQHTARPDDITIAAGRMPSPHLHSHNLLMGPGVRRRNRQVGPDRRLRAHVDRRAQGCRLHGSAGPRASGHRCRTRLRPLRGR